MPNTVNGIGTWYYGKKNIFERTGACPHCNKIVALSSYDTSKYIVVLFVPIVPLGKKHVIDQCPACKMHFQFSLKKWCIEKDNSLNEVISDYEKNPLDAETAKKAVETFIHFHQISTFLEMAPRLNRDFADNTEVLNHISEGYEYFGREDEAEKAYRASLVADGDQNVCERLAFCLIRQSRPKEAAEFLRHIIDERLAEKASYLIVLAESYQELGEHFEAMSVLDNAVDIAPALAKDKAFKKTQKISQKYLHTNTPVKSKAIGVGKLQSISKLDFNARHVWIIASLVIVIALAAYFYASYHQGLSRGVYFVNGLSRTYTVRVNGESHTLRPLAQTKIKTGEGTVVIDVDDELITILTQKHQIKTSFLWRPFINKTFIINPDSLAIVLWEKLYYVMEGRNAPDDQSKLYTGKTLYIFDGIDYAFQHPPKTVDSSEGNKIAKERISLFTDLGISTEQLSSIIANQIGRDVMIDFLKKHLAYEPEVETYLYLLYAQVEPNEFTQIIRPGLKAKPIRIDWHRMYQTMKERTQPEYDIVDEYRKLLEKDPENPSLQYLLGRAIEPNEAMQLFRKSVAGDEPCPYSYNAMAYHKLSIAQFDEALKYSRHAVRLKPDSINFQQQFHKALKATGHYDEAIEEFRKLQKKSSYDYMWVWGEMDLWLIKGEQQQAWKVYDKWLKRLKLQDDIAKELTDSVSIRFAYLSGDLKQYEQKTKDMTDPNDILGRDLVLQKPADPKFVSKLQIKEPSIYLQLYMVAQLSGQTEQAQQYLSNAVELLYSQGRETRLIADCLAGRKQPVPDEICNMSLDTQTKAVILTAMGVKYPHQKQPYFELAQKLNFDRSAPYLLLKSILEE